jgi:hypothetical protein
VRAGLCEPERDLAADPSSGARDDRDLSIHLETVQNHSGTVTGSSFHVTMPELAKASI